MNRLRKRQVKFSLWYVVLAVLIVTLFQSYVLRQAEPRVVAWSELVALVETGKVKEAMLEEDRIVGVLKEAPPSERGKALVEATRLPGIDESSLVEQLRARGVQITGRIEKPSFFMLLLPWLLPIALLALFYWVGMRRVARGAGPMIFGKSRLKVYDQAAAEKVTFAEVAGVDEAKAELVEVVDFLKNPGRYQALGARIPRGVLLVGPPGTGKTLLAKAVAGEADVPFFSISGSEFVELFVGVGAARVRDLFQQAKSRAPCIVFIDELDAIGRSRGGPRMFATHEEREQTLNQLLVEMDGFDASKGVVLVAATNRPEVLDKALLRPGRFDRRVVVDRPDVAGRQAILVVHARKVKLDRDVKLEIVARRTPGMVGADLANVVNEAALAAARRRAELVMQHDFEEAIDRMQLGLKRPGRAMSEEEKRRVAYHEAGHALVALSVEHADPVHRVTIIPRTIGALGATLQLPTEERYLVTADELRDQLSVMLAGRAAEEIECRDISTGAQNDLERATETARQMVCRFGMSDRLGPLTYGRSVGAAFLEAPLALGQERTFSEETARAIDSEVRRIIDLAHGTAHEILQARRAALDELARRLLERETLEQSEVEEITGPPRSERVRAARAAEAQTFVPNVSA